MLKKSHLISLIFLSSTSISVQAKPISDLNNSLPAKFIGKIIYVGAVEAIITTPSIITPIANGGVISDPKSNLQSTSRSQGNYYTEIDYNGNKISGRYFIPEAPEVATRFKGIKQGDHCALIDENGNQFTSQCTANEFVSELVYWDEQGKMYELYVQARSTDASDLP